MYDESIEGSYETDFDESVEESEIDELAEDTDSGDGTNSGEVELSETECTVSVDLDYIPIDANLNDLGFIGVSLCFILIILALALCGGGLNEF